MANKKISELPYINGGKLSGNTLVPLVTYFSAATGDTVHTYVSDLQTYLTSGITGNTVVGSFLPLSGGTVTGQTFFTSGVTITGDTIIVDPYGNYNVDTTSRLLYNSGGINTINWDSGLLYDYNTSLTSVDFTNRTLNDSGGNLVVDWINLELSDSLNVSLNWAYRNLTDSIGGPSVDWENRKLYTSIGEDVFDWENGILTGQTNIESSTISATTYLNLPNGYYDTTGITSSQSITWDKTYWGISGSSNVDITLPSTTSKDGHILIIKDESGLAGSYRIRVTPTSGLIDGNSYIDMNINFMSLTFVARNNNWWII
jgi:hypothetical protein